MNVVSVTFTGVDERTDLKRLLEISSRFPFVEWGLLRSFTKTEMEPMYPSKEFIQQFSHLGVRKSVHLCGTFAREVARGQAGPVLSLVSNMASLDRIQINLGRTLPDFPNALASLQNLALSYVIPIILQCSDFNMVQKQIGFEAWTKRHQTRFGVCLLHDASGGKGFITEWEAPLRPGLVGYAGGLGPYDIADRLAIIQKMPEDNPVWVDMKTKVRTDDWFDLDKVKAVCEAAAPFITQENKLPRTAAKP